MRLQRCLPWLGLLLAACERDEPVRAATAGLPTGETIAGSYSWAAGREVPWFTEDSFEQIPFGELGRTPATALYLTFNGGDLARELGLQGRPWTTPDPVGDPAPGRFGGGWRLERDQELRLAIPEELHEAQQWTIEAWIRPEALVRGALGGIPGLLLFRTDDQGRVDLEIPEAGLTQEGKVISLSLKSPEPLVAGQWNHVGIVLDLRDAPGARIAVNGEGKGRRLQREIHGKAQELVLGGPDGRTLPCTIDELRLQTRAANTEEFEEALAPPRAAETLRVTTPGGPKELERWFEPLVEPRVDSSEAWARGELERVVAGDDGLCWVEGQWRQIQAVDRPLARTTHATAFLGQHRVLMFGGETRDSHFGPMRNTDDTWLFDTSAEKWERLELSPAPAGRCHQAVAYSPDLDVVLLTGGFRNDSDDIEHLLDTWYFHVKDRRWEELSGKAQLHEAINDHVLVYHPRLKQFVFVAGSEIMTFDPEERRWQHLPRPTVVDESGAELDVHPLPSMIGGYAPTTDEIVLFGGCRDPQDDTQFVDDTYVLDMNANRMTLLAPSADGERPSPRVRSGFGWDSKRSRFVLFGGVRSQRSERMDDLWTFDPSDRSWQRHEAAHTPAARGGYYGMEYDPQLDRFFLLCGRHSHARFLAESWTLSLDGSAAGHARYVFDRAAFPGATDWNVEPETPGDSSVELRFRESADGLAWSEWTVELPATQRFLQVELTLRPGSQGEVPRVAAMGFREPH